MSVNSTQESWTANFISVFLAGLWGYKPMSKLKKILEAIRNNPKDVRFEDACKVAGRLGFSGEGGSGSHRAFARPGEPNGLNFQDRGGKIAAYQARQLIAMIDKYGDEL